MNITNNRLDLVLTDPQIAAAVQHFTDLKAGLPPLIGLTADEKKAMPGIDVSNKQWALDCLNEMEQDPSLLPGFLTPNNVKRDLVLFDQLEVIKVNALDFADRISDTQYLAGAEAYAVCLIYYRILEAAAKAGIPGADERYNRLKSRFMGQGPQGGEQPEGTTPPVNP